MTHRRDSSRPATTRDDRESLRERLIGLGEGSIKKSYFPELRSRMGELERFHTLLDRAGDAIFLADAAGLGFIYANQAAGELTGRTPDEILGLRASDIIGQAGRKRLESLQGSTDSGRQEPLRTTVVTAAGNDVPVEAALSLHEVEDKQYAVMVVRDITERVRRESELKRHRQAMEASMDGMAILDETGRYLYANLAHARIYGFTDPEELAGRSWRELYGPDELERFDKRIFAELGSRGYWRGEAMGLRRDGRRFHQEVSLAMLDTGGTVCVVRDISDRKELEAMLVHQAMHDPLTGLGNRNLCLERLNEAIGRSRAKGGGFFAALFVDLDRFNVVNDSLGHTIGDRLLRAVAERLAEAVEDPDMVSRIGGDEFIVVLEGERSVKHAYRKIRHMRDRLRRPYGVSGREIQITASMGIVHSLADYDRPEEVLQNANIALNQAKKSGRDRFRVFNRRMLDQALFRMTIENDLVAGLDQGQFRLVYQPVMRLDGEGTPRISGFEALVRWNHPEQGNIAPGLFIPVAEETGLINELGLWVLRRACSQLAAWREMLPEAELTMSVNLSGAQLTHYDLMHKVRSVLDETKADPRALKMEVTETAIMANAAKAKEILGRLSDLGIGVTVDDFGTGYSSMSYLQQLPLDGLKVDLSFVRNLHLGRENLEIVRSIVNLAHTLGLYVVAEGVELKEHEGILRGLECDFFQGYYYSRPLELDAAETFLRGHAPQAEASGRGRRRRESRR